MTEYFGIPKEKIKLEKGRTFDDRTGWKSEYWYVETEHGVYGMIREEAK